MRPSVPQDLLAPGITVAGKYVIERTLGRGGMGAVYVVSHAVTGKRLALKALLPEFVHNADLVGRFLREAQVMGRLQHRHVVDVFDVGRDGDVLFIVMELLEGKPLSDLLHDTTLTLEETLLILLRAMEGVAAAHDQGIVHRDLKPDNIFITIGASGRLDDPRVLDFGISKLDDPEGPQLTRSGVAMGTPYYMSIEQLSGQRDLDQRVDVYALGVILYEAIAGEPPYLADSVSALAIRVLTSEPVHLGSLRPDLPPGLAEVVMKAIARNREDRHRSVRALIEALRPFVPKSAGLLVPEGQGRPLRTPRSASARPVAGVSGVRGSAHAGAQPGAAPRARPAAERAEPRPRARWGRRSAALIAVLLAAGALAFASERYFPSWREAIAPFDPKLPVSTEPSANAAASEPESPNAAPALREPAAASPGAGPGASAPDAPGSSAPGALGAPGSAASSGAPDAERAQGAPERSDPPGPESDEAHGEGEPRARPLVDAGKARESGARAKARAVVHKPKSQAVKPAGAAVDPAPSVQPEPKPPAAAATPLAPPSKSAQGRAGRLGSDEF